MEDQKEKKLNELGKHIKLNEVIDIPEEGDVIAVFWTLKKWFWNHSVMERAEWIPIDKEAYVEISSLRWIGFPIANFIASPEGETKHLLSVELFKVSKKGITWPLDLLEGYPTHYKRVRVPVLNSDLEVIQNNWAIIYQINSISYTDAKKDFEVKNHPKATNSIKFYNWK